MQDDAPLVAVIDDDAATCRAVSRLLDAVGYRVRTYTNPRDYLDELDVAPPICVLVDILMPEFDGLALLREMRHSGSDVPAVFMTGTGHVPTVVEAMKEGALDLLSKPFTADALCATIARATDSSRRVHGERRDLVDLWRQVEKLTPREAEVAALVACGLLNKHVAMRIGTKEKTVKVHRGRVMQKLQAPSLAELVRMVDRLFSEQAPFVKLDGVEARRPRAADIITDVISRERSQSQKQV